MVIMYVNIAMYICILEEGLITMNTVLASVVGSF
jgi:hypothetical protein